MDKVETEDDKIRELVPEDYHEFLPVFKKAVAEVVPPYHPYDHKILSATVQSRIRSTRRGKARFQTATYQRRRNQDAGAETCSSILNRQDTPWQCGGRASYPQACLWDGAAERQAVALERWQGES